MVMVDGSRRLTIRDRRHLRKILAPINLDEARKEAEKATVKFGQAPSSTTNPILTPVWALVPEEQPKPEPVPEPVLADPVVPLPPVPTAVTEPIPVATVPENIPRQSTRESVPPRRLEVRHAEL